MRPVVRPGQRDRARFGRGPGQLGQPHSGRNRGVHGQQREDMRAGQVVPERRGPVQDGLRADRAAVSEQVAEKITGEPALRVEQMPLLEQQQRDGATRQ